MSKRHIIIYMPTPEGMNASWAIWDEHQTLIQSVFHRDLSEFPNASENITLIIPGQDALITKASLPKLSKHQRELALPYALEDQLIDDVNDLHFAIAPEEFQDAWPVVVMHQTQMTAWLSTLNRLKIQPTRLCIAPLALPLIQNHWTVFEIGECCFIRLTPYAGLTVETNQVELYLKALLTQSIPSPEQIDVYRTTELTLTLNKEIPIVEQTISPQEGLDYFNQGLSSTPTLNLLQKKFRAKHSFSSAKQFWQYAILISCAMVLLGFTSQLIAYGILRTHVAALHTKIMAIYKREFPEATNMITPKERMDSKLKKLAEAASNESFLVLIAEMSKAFHTVGGTRLQNLDYRDKQLTAAVTANSFDDLDQLMSALQQQGLHAKQQNAEMVAGRVKATLLFTGRAA